MSRTFVVEAARRITSTRSTRHVAETTDAACAEALGDDRWRASETDDPDNVGYTFITAVHEVGDATTELSVPSHCRNRRERRCAIFDDLVRGLEVAVRGRPLPPAIHALLQKARAIQADEPDPGLLDLQTPWGVAETICVYGDGCIFYDTVSHGGIRLDENRNNEIPDAWRREDRWYEEDHDIHFVIVTFPQFFAADAVVRSRRLIREFEKTRE